MLNDSGREAQVAEQLLTTDEAAKELRASGETVRALVRAGKLGAFRLSDAPKARIRIPRSELDRFMHRNHDLEVA